MAYAFAREESVPDGVQRITCEELDGALAHLTGGDGSPTDDAVHEARKSLKRLRALLRLTRRGLGRDVAGRENAVLRHAGRLLSEVRDATVLLETFEGLVEQGESESVRRALQRHQRLVRTRVLERGDAVTPAVTDLHEVRDRVSRWPLDADGWVALEPGVRRAYRRGRKAMRRIGAETDEERWHDWRKRVKDVWYHLTLLQPADPDRIGVLEAETHHLSDLLGDEHDLAVLRARVVPALPLCDDPVQVEALVERIDASRTELQHDAREVGSPLYGSKPKAFTRPLGKAWRRWQGG